MIVNDSASIYVRPARLTDADYLARRLRRDDLREIQAVSGEKPAQALRRSIETSCLCYAVACPAERCIALFGVVPDAAPAGSASIWLLASPMLERFSVAFLRKSLLWVEALNRQYSILWNYVDARNKKHIRWLQWCGFTLTDRPVVYGFEKRPFYFFRRVH